jgi:hypothetical protein
MFNETFLNTSQTKSRGLTPSTKVLNWTRILSPFSKTQEKSTCPDKVNEDIKHIIKKGEINLFKDFKGNKI